MLGRLVDHGLHGKGHHAHEDRQARLALHQRVAADGMIEAVAGIMRLGDDRVEGGAEQGRVHLVGDLFHPARQNGQGDRVDICGLGHALGCPADLTSAMSFQTS